MTATGHKPIRFAICGTGRMAHVMAQELNGMAADNVLLAAVVSRAKDRGAAFAGEHSIARVHVGIEALAADGEIDAVYLATPPAGHARELELLIGAGKAVLCEKPFTLNGRQARDIAERARRSRVLVVEAMWTRFLPAVRKAHDMLSGGAIGAPQFLVAGGAFMPPYDPTHYLQNRELGGGVLLDAGVYLISMASLTLGKVRHVMASAAIGEHAVDDHDAMLIEYHSGARALLYVSLRARRMPDAEWTGPQGTLWLPGPIFRPTRIVLRAAGRAECILEEPCEGSGYGYQLREFVAALRAGRTESETLPLAETLAVMDTMDAVRAAIGMHYDCDTRAPRAAP